MDGNQNLDLVSILHAMRTRVPWMVGQRILKAANFPRGKGWDLTIAKILEGQWVSGEVASLLRAYKEHLICGEKSVTFLQIEDEQCDSLRGKLANLSIPGSPMATAYPFPIPPKELEQASMSLPQPVAVERHEDGLALILSSIREIEVREKIPVSSLPDSTAKVLAGFATIYGIKVIKRQTFDVLWVPHHSNIVSMRVDCAVQQPIEQTTQEHDLVRSTLTRMFRDDFSGKPVNLFPLIDLLYRDDTKGKVTELGFWTNSDSMKHEKMKSAGTCLREEPYHIAGSGALSEAIQPYRIQIEWTHQIAADAFTNPELSIIGRSEMLEFPGAVLLNATLRKCAGIADFEAICDTLLDLL